MRGRAGEVVKTLTRRKVVVCCVQEIRWRGTSTRLIKGKHNKYKIIWVGNNFGLGGVKILVARKWTDKIFDVKRVNYQYQLLIAMQIIATVSTYAQQQRTS